MNVPLKGLLGVIDPTTILRKEVIGNTRRVINKTEDELTIKEKLALGLVKEEALPDISNKSQAKAFKIKKTDIRKIKAVSVKALQKDKTDYPFNLLHDTLVPRGYIKERYGLTYRQVDRLVNQRVITAGKLRTVGRTTPFPLPLVPRNGSNGPNTFELWFKDTIDEWFESIEVKPVAEAARYYEEQQAIQAKYRKEVKWIINETTFVMKREDLAKLLHISGSVITKYTDKDYAAIRGIPPIPKPVPKGYDLVKVNLWLNHLLCKYQTD